MNDQKKRLCWRSICSPYFIDSFTFLWGIFREHYVISVF
jgi:hypothetical protein